MRSVIGVVRHVVDGDSFDVECSGTEFGGSSRLQRMRIAGNYAPEAGSFAGLLAASILRRQLLGRTVQCEVHGHDGLGRLVCTVEVLPAAVVSVQPPPEATTPLQPLAMSAS